MPGGETGSRPRSFGGESFSKYSMARETEIVPLQVQWC